MQKRFRFLGFLFLLIWLLFALETKADVMLPTWGEVIQNNCYLNIKIEDHGVTLHQTIQMKLKKLVNDDYLYTFTAFSRCGEFVESSLSVRIPPSGLKDSIFYRGCKLEYLSQVALEETLDVAFEYEYQYPYQDLGEILYERLTSTYLYRGEILDTNEFVDISCNQEIELKERQSHWSDYWRTVGKGTHIVYHPSSWWESVELKICMSAYEIADTLIERTLFELIPERRAQIPNLIEEEFVTIEFTEVNEEIYAYHLYGTIELDLDVADPIAPFYGWFPNDQTDALVKIEGIYESVDYPDTTWEQKIDVLKVESSVLGEQKGFYILIPKLSDPYGYHSRRCIKAKLVVEIEGLQSEGNCDFILVTAPQEYSSVKFKIPERFSFGNCFSPFEHDITYREEEFKVKKFYGRCLSTGIAHVEWGTSASPENVSLFQNYPNPFNQETVIKYFLPWDCEVKLSVYNLLGERVRTLVDQRRSGGNYEIRWDGKDDQGIELASGVYLYRLQAGKFTQSNKMLLLK